jgi:hypothetical protein
MMLKKLDKQVDIDPIREQVAMLGIQKRLDLNKQTGKFFNDPWEILPAFKNTPLGNVLDSLGNIGQARLLCLDSAESYTAHADPDDRIHLAIVTNPYSFLVDVSDNHLYHVPADGQLWYMDTGKIHVAANWGPRTRIHLNVRVLLPKFDPALPGLQIKVVDGDYDWKQNAYTPIMSEVNQHIKLGNITGFDSVSEKELFVNTVCPTILDTAFDLIKQTNVKLEVTRLNF